MRLKPHWAIGLGIYLAYAGWVAAAWAFFGIDYASLGKSANLLRGVILPLGLAAFALCIFNGLAQWWPQTTREPRMQAPMYQLALALPMCAFIALNIQGADWASMGLQHALVLAGAMLLVGFCEEMVHRGILLVCLRHALGSEAWVWFWSSALFGLMHASNAFFGLGAAALLQVVLAFCAGTALYLLRRLTGSLWVAMLFHALWDFSSLAHALGHATQSGAALAALGATYLSAFVVLVLVLRKRPEVVINTYDPS